MPMSKILSANPIVPVVTLDDADKAQPLVEALIAGGIHILEITLRTPAALAAIQQVSQHYPDFYVGAGTVLDEKHFVQAQEAGAKFAVSPGITDKLEHVLVQYEFPFLPGVATASEVMLAREMGFKQLKFFPARMAGGIDYLKALQGPFPEIQFCPTGGIQQDNYQDYLALPNVLAVGGSWLVPPSAIAAGDWAKITQLARAVAR
jgi:2-dehydro-3-deoxyphosphogluconate aldolase/(4S)-4-hydroxy-2-oxoglutarate aldolase